MDADETATSRAFLREEQYRDERNLEARRAIYSYAVEGGDFITPAVEAVGDAASVLDVGCGPGLWHDFLAAMRPECWWVGVDLSAGMVTAAAGAGRAPTAVADAVALPVADRAFDAGLSVHMLYHVPSEERHAALAELARVVRPGRPVIVTTNAPDHLVELDELLVDAGADIGLDLPHLGSTLSFLLDRAGHDQVADVFGAVETLHASGHLAIPDADVVASYIGSLHSLPELGPDSPGEDIIGDLVEAARRRAQAEIDRNAAFSVRTHAGVFVARA